MLAHAPSLTVIAATLQKADPGAHLIEEKVGGQGELVQTHVHSSLELMPFVFLTLPRPSSPPCAPITNSIEPESHVSLKKGIPN